MMIRYIHMRKIRDDAFFNVYPHQQTNDNNNKKS